MKTYILRLRLSVKTNHRKHNKAKCPPSGHFATKGQKMQKIGFLSGNMLKIIAALAMLADHVGVLIFPQYDILRIIGRLAFPIFAFMIAEGCKYTRNIIRYFFMIFGLAFICQAVYFFFMGSLFMCVLVTFSLSILALFALNNFKTMLFEKDCAPAYKFLAAGLFVSCIVFIYALNQILTIDYGFWGCMLPVFAGAFHMPKNCNVKILKKLDNHYVSIAMMALCLFPVIDSIGFIQGYSLWALVPLTLYSGKRGKLNMKYFFYIFYPLHLVALEIIYVLMQMA